MAEASEQQVIVPAAAPAAGDQHPSCDWGWADTWLLTWLWPLVRKGYSAPLQAFDVPALPSALAAPAARHIAIEWWLAREQAAAAQTKLSGSSEQASLRPTLIKMALTCHRTEIVLGMIASLAYGLLNVVLRPLLLKLTIELVSRISSSGSSDEMTRSILLIAAIGGSLVLEGVVAAASKHFLSDRLGTALFGKAAALVQRKAVRLQTASVVQVRSVPISSVSVALSSVDNHAADNHAQWRTRRASQPASDSEPGSPAPTKSKCGPSHPT